MTRFVRPAEFPRGCDTHSHAPRSPDTLVKVKHEHNPPVVTIFGAGIAGLTAAHELVARGCLVQVVEARRDRYARGRPQVGGMAASQYARIRAHIGDLHRGLLEDPSVSEDVRQLLLRIFAFNRSAWIQTEAPIEINTTLFTDPRNNDAFGTTFRERLVARLKEGKQRYRERWLWDLIVRTQLEPTLRANSPDLKLAVLQQLSDSLEATRQLSALDLGLWILILLKSTGERRNKLLPDLPSEGDMKKHAVAITKALEREFLCFRLVPHARSGSKQGPERALKLHEAYLAFFRDQKELAINLLESPHEQVRVVHGDPADDGASDRHDVWIQLEIVEKRLPGEHGFRFFPSYYRHIDDTMSRIPLYANGSYTFRTAYDNLCATQVEAVGLSERDFEDHVPDYKYWSEDQKRDSKTVELKRDRPKSFEGIRNRTDRFLKRLGCTRKDSILFSARMLKFMTASPLRRRGYEDLSWAQFVGIDEAPKCKPLAYSDPMKHLLQASAQCLLALSAGEADARTYGDAFVQLLLDMFEDGSRTDRTLNGPTSDAWLEPWREHLERQGVRFFLGKLDHLDVNRQTGEVEIFPVVSQVTDSSETEQDREFVSQNGYRLIQYDPKNRGRSPDFYVLALDVEEAARVVKRFEADHGRLDEPGDFQKLVDFHGAACTSIPFKRSALKDMTGVQFFFDARTKIGDGHIVFPYSDWGLSSISQSEFWSERGGFVDGYLGVLSVDVSQTNQFSRTGRGIRAGTFKQVLSNRLPPPRRPVVARNQPLTGDEDGLGRWLIAHEIWQQIRDRIPRSDGLAEPRAFHVDRNVDSFPPDDSSKYPRWENRTHYLAALPGTWEMRPGLHVKRNAGKKDKDAKELPGEKEKHAKELPEIKYGLAAKRWVLAGTFMATHTRMTTMEAANESGRHAVNAILHALETDLEIKTPGVEHLSAIYHYTTGVMTNYNGGGPRRKFDTPDIYDPEQHELEDLAVFRRLDERLCKLDLPHWMEICEFERRLNVFLEMLDLTAPEAISSERLETAVDVSLAGLKEVLRAVLGEEAATDVEGRVQSVVGGDRTLLVDRLMKLMHEMCY